MSAASGNIERLTHLEVVSLLLGNGDAFNPGIVGVVQNLSDQAGLRDLRISAIEHSVTKLRFTIGIVAAIGAAFGASFGDLVKGIFG